MVNRLIIFILLLIVHLDFGSMFVIVDNNYAKKARQLYVNLDFYIGQHPNTKYMVAQSANP